MPAELRQAAAETIAAREFPLAITPGIDRLRLHADEDRDQSAAADAEARGGGRALALPVVAGRGKPLIMRAWRWGEPLAAGVWGIREPKPEAPEVEPDILLVPLLAFDRAGHRIGYGAGYYDMTIAALRARKADHGHRASLSPPRRLPPCRRRPATSGSISC